MSSLIPPGSARLGFNTTSHLRALGFHDKSMW